MKGRLPKLAVGLLLTVFIIISCTPAAPEDISSLLEPIRQEYNLPALAAAVILDGRTVALGVVGERKYGSGVAVTNYDQFHLGSCGKAITATLLAILVEQGKLSWTTTLAEVFPELVDEMLPKYRSVTLLHLLSHRAGLPGQAEGQVLSFATDDLILEWYHRTDPIVEQRYEVAEVELCAVEHASLPDPGERFIYANTGYIIAAAVAERVTSSSWEELVAELIFEPLGITTAGFGAMGSEQLMDQPWQHQLVDGEVTPISPDLLGSDLPPVLVSAGLIHMSIGDWAKFINAHLEGEHGRSKLLTQETFKLLHTPPFASSFPFVLGGEWIDGYALGWGIGNTSWARGTVMTHAGSNGRNWAEVWMAPEHGFAVLVTTNISYPDSPSPDDAATEVLNTLVSRYLPEGE